MSGMNGSVLRLLDANANRAREALRVLEDYARFILNDAALSEALKSLRHELAAATGPLLADGILHRDTPGDVGTAIATPAERRREDLPHVITAAGKRLGEALRSIEEFFKIAAPDAAARIEKMRYEFYEIEQRLARTLRPADRFAGVRLYVLITQSLCRRPWPQVAREAIAGGADCLQLREKDLPAAEFLQRARLLVALCREHNVPCIINDRPDVAILADADGVHVGQEDLPAAEARKLVGAGKIVGVSTHNLEQARQAVLDGADYIGVGPFFRSETKPRDFLAGPEFARQATREIQIPAVAIAGINASNVDEVLATGIRAIAVSAAVIAADDVRNAAAELKRKIMDAGMRPGLPAASAPNLTPDNAKVGQTFLSASSLPQKRPAALEITHRRLPHWHLDGSVYFVTFRVVAEPLGPEHRQIVLDHFKTGDGKWYELFAAVIMPDHVHILLKPNKNVSLSRIIKGLKGVSARLVNAVRSTGRSLWQAESFDRIIRDQSEFDEKLRYMLNNPVKKGLIDDPWEYDGWYYKPQRESGEDG